MAGPWEKYAQQAQAAPNDAAPSGPWSKYQAQAPAPSSDPSLSDHVAAATQGFGQMATAGYIPELTAAAGSMVPNPSADVDAKLRAQGFNIQQPEDTYAARRDASRVMQKQMADSDPVAYYGGGAAGAIASAPIYGAAMKGLGIAKEIAPVASDAGFLAKAGNLGSRMVQAGKEGAALGLAANPNSEAGEEGFNAGRRVLNAGTGAVASAAIPAAIDSVKGAANLSGAAAKWGGTKLLSSLGGVKPETIREYAQFSDRINAAPAPEALKQISDDFVGKLSADVEAKKINFDQAQDAFKAFQSEIKDAYRTAGYDARDAVTSAQQTLKDAHNERIQQLSGDLYDTVNKLKSDVKAQSGQALETLNKSNAKVDLDPVLTQIDSTIDRMKAAGTDDALSIADKLQAYKERLMTNQSTKQTGFQPTDKIQTLKPATYENEEAFNKSTGLKPARWINGSKEDQWLKYGLLGKEIAPPVEFQPIGPKLGSSSQIDAASAKKLIQGLDQITEYSPMAGAFDKAKNGAFKGVRSALDETLKSTVPEYAEKMKQVASDAGLLNQVQDFGDKQSAASLLSRLESPNQFERKAALEALGKKYGVDFVAAAKPENLPQQKLLSQAQANLENLRPDRVAEKIDGTLASSRQKALLDSAEAAQSQAEEKLAPFRSLAPNSAGQTQAQQKLSQLGAGKNIELEKMFHELGKMTDTDFVQAMKDRHVLAAFEKGATNGSRNTLLGSVIGFVSGGVGGAAVGASAGRVADQWGPAITKKILDGAIQVARSPSVATIQSLDLPAQVKRNMVVGLENYLAKEGSSARPSMVASRDQEPAQAANNPSQRNRTPAKGYADGGPVIDPDKAKAFQGGFFGSLGGGKKPATSQPKLNDSQAQANYAFGGGPVPGRAKVDGNSSENDTVHAMLSPGEIVLPRSITQAKNAPEAAAKFVSHHLNKARGEDKWAQSGAEKLGLSDQDASRLMQSKAGKALLIQASDLPPGSKAMQRIKDQIRKGSR